MFKEIRRKDRVLDDNKRVTELLSESEYGFLSLGNLNNDYSYGIPISYAYDENSNTLYFHCAPEGQKTDLIKQNNKVSFCVIGNTKPIKEKFTTLYESVIAFGDAYIIEQDEEKRKALRLLIDKYSKGHEVIGEKYIDVSWNRTLAFKVEIKHITAKAKHLRQ